MVRNRTLGDAQQNFKRCLPKRLMLPKIGFYHPENKDKTPNENQDNDFERENDPPRL